MSLLVLTKRMRAPGVARAPSTAQVADASIFGACTSSQLSGEKTCGGEYGWLPPVVTRNPIWPLFSSRSKPAMEVGPESRSVESTELTEPEVETVPSCW